MKDHLDDVEFAGALAGDELAGEAAEHLVTCVSCRRQLAEMRGWIEQRHERVEREAPDWGDQLEQIADRLSGFPVSRDGRWQDPG